MKLSVADANPGFANLFVNIRLYYKVIGGLTQVINLVAYLEFFDTIANGALD